jgi:hypothetical protein
MKLTGHVSSSAVALFVLAAPTLGQATSQERTVPGPIKITHTGIPLVLKSEGAPPGNELGLQARSLGHASGNAVGARIQAVGNSPMGATASGLEVTATAGESSASVPAIATGITVDASALASGTMMVGATATGIHVTASQFSPPEGEAIGVYASAGGGSTSAIGVYGVFTGDDQTGGAGILGEDLSGSVVGYGVLSRGDLLVTGNKMFAQPDPDDPRRVVQFVCLEGNESGTYFRGSTRLSGGVAEIPIPEEWRLVSETDGITVQLTPRGSPTVLYVTEQSRDRIVVQGTPDCEFSYLVNGVRRGFADYQPYVENITFRPRVRGVPFGQQYPQGLRDLLVRNGILAADYTPNEATARALGWDLEDPEDVPIERRWWLDGRERARLSAVEAVTAER